MFKPSKYRSNSKLASRYARLRLSESGSGRFSLRCASCIEPAIKAQRLFKLNFVTLTPYSFRQRPDS